MKQNLKYLGALLLSLAPVSANAKVDLNVILSEQKIDIYQNGVLVDSRPIAVGSDIDPTPTGTYKIRAIDINPDWTSTRGKGYYKPGPDVPLGRVRMRYDGTYALHGTNNPDSIGTYVTLGCVRMYNEDILGLAEFIFKDTGNWKGYEWFDNMVINKYRMYHIPLKEAVTITITE